MHRIILRKTATCWTAETVDGDREEIIRLFGTAILPTAYTEKADGKHVRFEIAKQNPGAFVELDRDN